MTVLTPKQEKFAQHYALHHNATEAYRSAGYKGNPAHVHRRAIEVLQNRNVSARIEELQERVKNRAEEVFDLTADKLLNQYVRIAFADAGDYYDWDEDQVKGRPDQRAAHDYHRAQAEQGQHVHDRAFVGRSHEGYGNARETLTCGDRKT
jgi:phage terminase small subunit